jgi:hypothetical protein
MVSNKQIMKPQPPIVATATTVRTH